MLKDFSIWQEYQGASEGSGRSEKIWLVNPDNGEIGLFKFPKTEHTTEHLSEKIAADLSTLIKIPCMKVELGMYRGRIGSLSYRLNQANENLIEGIQLINRYYPYYNEETLYDSQKDEYYSLEMILHSLAAYDLKKDFLAICTFDFLIGNTDRHHSNWAVLQRDQSIKLCPLYDNGSSLCCYIPEAQLASYLGKDQLRFQALVDSKSRSRIRINKKIKKEPTHLEVLHFIRVNHYHDVISLVQKILASIDTPYIDSLLGKYDVLLSKPRMLLIKKFLLAKVNLMARVFKPGEEGKMCP